MVPTNNTHNSKNISVNVMCEFVSKKDKNTLHTAKIDVEGCWQLKCYKCREGSGIVQMAHFNNFIPPFAIIYYQQ
jgi:hypothetical protein